MTLKLMARMLVTVLMIGGISSAGAALWPGQAALLQVLTRQVANAPAALPADADAELAGEAVAAVESAVFLPVRVLEVVPDQLGLIPSADAEVTVVRDGIVQTRELVKEAGVAQIPHSGPGSYSFIVNSVHGMGVASVPVFTNAVDEVITIPQIAASDLPILRPFLAGTPAEDLGPTIAGSPVEAAPAPAPSFSYVLDANQGFEVEVAVFSGYPIMKTPLAGAQVLLVRNGAVVKETVADANGNVSFTGVPPGLYSFIAASQSGVAAVSVMLEPGDLQASIAAEFGVTNVSTTATMAASSGTVGAVGAGDLGAAGPGGFGGGSGGPRGVPTTAAAPAGGGAGGMGPGGGGMSGGGGMPGGGGMGWAGLLLGAAGVGLAAAALADDNDNNRPTTP